MSKVLTIRLFVAKTQLYFKILPIEMRTNDSAVLVFIGLKQTESLKLLKISTFPLKH